MSETEAVRSWLKLMCQMIPGIKQAVFVICPKEKNESCNSIYWPSKVQVDKRIVDQADASIKHRKLIDKVLSSEHDDSSVEIIVAYYFGSFENFSGSLSILLNAKPSQRAIIIQMLQWGEKWLQLLLQHHKTHSIAKPQEPTSKTLRDRLSSFNLKSFKGLAVIGVVLVIMLSLLKGTYHVTAPASIEGRIQRVIVAPFDSFIQSAHVRAGENVSAGDLLAELDKNELLIEQQRYLAQKNEYSRQHRQALAQRDMAQVAIFKSQMRQAEAKLDLTQKKIQRSSLVAPIDGVIITGDLSRSLGAPVKVGDVLFEIAPLDEYRLVMLVDEKQIAEVKVNMSGVLNLKALPATDLDFVVNKVSPVFEDKAGGIAYRVEASFNQPNNALRPGMQGVAKIAVTERSFAWIYFHEIYYAVRFWLWSWWI